MLLLSNLSTASIYSSICSRNRFSFLGFANVLEPIRAVPNKGKHDWNMCLCNRQSFQSIYWWMLVDNIYMTILLLYLIVISTSALWNVWYYFHSPGRLHAEMRESVEKQLQSASNIPGVEMSILEEEAVVKNLQEQVKLSEQVFIPSYVITPCFD